MNSRYRYLTVFLVLILMGCNPSPAAQVNAPQEDLDAIRQTTLDYIEGWYEGNAARMERSLHPDLVKRTIRDNQLVTVGAEEMVNYTRAGAGKAYQGDKKFSVTILGVYNDIATVRADSPEYVDYLQIGKVNGKWVILDALWTGKQSK